MPSSWPMNTSQPGEPTAMEELFDGTPSTNAILTRYPCIAALQGRLIEKTNTNVSLQRRIGSLRVDNKKLRYELEVEKTRCADPRHASVEKHIREILTDVVGIVLSREKVEGNLGRQTAQSTETPTLQAEIAHLTELEAQWRQTLGEFEEINQELADEVDEQKEQVERYRIQFGAYMKAFEDLDIECTYDARSGSCVVSDPKTSRHDAAMAAMKAELAAKEKESADQRRFIENVRAGLLKHGISISGTPSSPSSSTPRVHIPQLEEMEDLQNDARLQEAEANALRCKLATTRRHHEAERRRLRRSALHAGTLARDLAQAKAFARSLLWSVIDAGVSVRLRADPNDGGFDVVRIVVPASAEPVVFMPERPPPPPYEERGQDEDAEQDGHDDDDDDDAADDALSQSPAETAGAHETLESKVARLEAALRRRQRTTDALERELAMRDTEARVRAADEDEARERDDDDRGRETRRLRGERDIVGMGEGEGEVEGARWSPSSQMLVDEDQIPELLLPAPAEALPARDGYFGGYDAGTAWGRRHSQSSTAVNVSDDDDEEGGDGDGDGDEGMVILGVNPDDDDAEDLGSWDDVL